jgi:D-aminoacyl-tRNA deacylase
MKIAVIVSKLDTAGMNIRNELLRNFEFITGADAAAFESISLFAINNDTVIYDEADSLDADFLVFATRHQSKTGEKTLSVHFPGNFGEANLGGRKSELCVAPAGLLKNMFKRLVEYGRDSGYDVTMEATHHGPFLKKPAMFIEIGSAEEQWKDPDAAKIIAKTIINGIKDYREMSSAAIGFGGIHYCSNFNKVLLRTNIALSHVCPKYSLMQLDAEMIRQMVERTYEKVELAILDWKGMSGEDKSHLIPLLDEAGLPWKKIKELRFA